MSVSMALMSSLTTTNIQCQPFPQTHFPFHFFSPKRATFGVVVHVPHAATDGGARVVVEAAEADVEGNGSPPAVAAVKEGGEVVKNFEDVRWVGGTWDLRQFQKDGKVDWDAVIDAVIVAL